MRSELFVLKLMLKDLVIAGGTSVVSYPYFFFIKKKGGGG